MLLEAKLLEMKKARVWTRAFLLLSVLMLLRKMMLHLVTVSSFHNGLFSIRFVFITVGFQ